MKIALPDGRMISFELEGSSDAPCIMLAHGVALDLRVWDELAGALTSHYRVLRYDSRGHGLSSTGSPSFSLSDLGNDAIAVMDALNIPKVHFVGLSMGGMVGMGLMLSHPQRLASASLCNARGTATAEYRKGWDDRIALVRKSGLEAIADATITRWFTPEFLQAHPPAINAVKDMVLATPPDGYCASAEALKNLDYVSKLHKNRVRALYLAGSRMSARPRT